MTRETIKDKVMQVARHDPFLTIEEIARESNTTVRYVRTILSEAKLSLMELRKAYAKNMERKLHNPPGASPQPSVKLAAKIDKQLHLTRVKDGSLARLLQVDEEEELLQVSQLQTINDIPVYVQLTTYAELTLAAQPGSLRQLLPDFHHEGKIIQGEQWVEVVKIHNQLQALLGSNREQPLLKLCIILYNEKQPIAVETQWIPSEGISLRWSRGLPELEVAFR